MDKPISVGDLVQVIRGTPCCGSGRTLGEIHRVTALRKTEALMCNRCLTIDSGMTVAELEGEDKVCEVSRLKRIPPLDELEGVKSQEPVKEYAR